jgi:hypothetical protein
MSNSLLTCPVDGCRWAVVVGVQPGQPFVMVGDHQAYAREMWQHYEDLVTAHAEEHGLVDYLRTILRLRQALAPEGEGL